MENSNIELYISYDYTSFRSKTFLLQSIRKFNSKEKNWISFKGWWWIQFDKILFSKCAHEIGYVPLLSTSYFEKFLSSKNTLNMYFSIYQIIFLVIPDYQNFHLTPCSFALRILGNFICKDWWLPNYIRIVCTT